MQYRKRASALMLAVCLLVSILPLPTMAEGEPLVYHCGLHAHSDGCYGPLKICTKPDHVHTQEAGCYTEETKTTCGLTEYGVHTHTQEDGCFNAEGGVICTTTQAHTHGEGCLAEGEYTCSHEAAHAHADPDCYEVTQNLTCQLHAHGEECYYKYPTLVCGEESDHTHDESCKIECSEAETCLAKYHKETCLKAAADKATASAVRVEAAKAKIAEAGELPAEVTNDNKAGVKAQLKAIEAAVEDLTDTEKGQLDLTAYTVAKAAVKELDIDEMHAMVNILLNDIELIKTMSEAQWKEYDAAKLAPIAAFARENGIFFELEAYANWTVINAAWTNPVPITSGAFGENNSLTWNYNTSTKQLTISGNGSMGDFTPHKPSGSAYYYPDTTIYVMDTPWKEYALEIQSVVIESGVTHVASRGFRFPNMTSLSIPATVNSFGDYCFAEAFDLTTVNWTGDWAAKTETIHIPEAMFDNCTSLGSGTVLTSWLPACFKGNIGVAAFRNTLFTVDFAELHSRASGVSYGRYAFQMPNISEVKIYDNITYLNSGNVTPFYNCGAETITFVDCPINYILTAGLSNLKSFVIPEGTTAIPAEAFSGCTSLSSITVPDSVTSIGAKAFYRTGITSFTIPSGVTVLEDSVFARTKLTEITIPETVTDIKEKAFAFCGDLKTITFLGDGDITIDRTAFMDTGAVNQGDIVDVDVAIGTVNISTKVNATRLNSILNALKNESYQAVTESTVYNCEMLKETVTTDGSLGTAISHTSYPMVKTLTITGSSYSGAEMAFGNSKWGEETLEELTINVTGAVELAKGVFLRAPLRTVKINASSLSFNGDAAFLNTMYLTNIDLSGVSQINVGADGRRSFDLNTTQDGGLSKPTRYVYFKDTAAYQAIGSGHFSGNDNTSYFVVNGGAVTAYATAAAMPVLYKRDETVTGWFTKDGSTDGDWGQEFTGTPAPGGVYYAKWEEKATPNFTLASDKASYTYGQDVILTATVAATKSKAAAPKTVDFYLDGQTEKLDTATLKDGVYSLTLTGLDAGSYTFYADFGGDDAFKPVAKSNTVTITVAKAAPANPYVSFEGLTEQDNILLVDSLDKSLQIPAVVGNVAGAALAYSSSDPAVATVDAATGEVTVKTAGPVVITATASSTNYENSTASYNLTIVADGAYQITEGGGQSFLQGYEAEFVSNADFAKRVGVRVDGAWLEPGSYTEASGSTKITLSTAYTKTLATGKHSLTIVSNDGAASTGFTVTAPAAASSGGSYNADSPKTGDTTNPALWLALAVIGVLGFAVATVGKKYLYSGKYTAK